MRVVLADDHTLVRAGIRALLLRLPGIQVIAEAREGEEALRRIREKRPDVVLMDIAMAGMNGLEATSRAVQEIPGLRIIILSMHAHEEYVWQALRAGAAGYVLKDAAPAELEQAIRTVLSGETYFSPSISRTVVSDFVQRAGGERGATPRLSPRRREVLRLIAEGFSTKEIALRLGISVKTVETHRSRLMEQLAIHDIAGLVRYAIRMGLVSPDR